jgi:hypothetical protein
MMEIRALLIKACFVKHPWLPIQQSRRTPSSAEMLQHIISRHSNAGSSAFQKAVFSIVCVNAGTTAL